MSDDALYLTPAQLAARLGLKLAAIRKWRVRGQGPAAHKFCGALRYKLADVERWEASCRERMTRQVHPRVEYPRVVFSAR